MVGAVVVDNSVLMPLVASDEDAVYSERVFRSAIGGTRLLAPALCMMEFGNAVLNCVRRERMTLGEAWVALDHLKELPIDFSAGAALRELAPTYALAHTTGLSFYDATYLMLAMTKSARLATLDNALRKAAEKQGVEVFA